MTIGSPIPGHRRKSLSMSRDGIGSPVLSPSDLMGSFVGSLQESLLSGRISKFPSTVFQGFSLDLAATSMSRLSPHLKCDFDTFYYHIDSNKPIPYVATIDLPSKPYKIPVSGLLQLTIFNPSKTPIKTLLARYDFSDMPPHSKTFFRQITRSKTDPPIMHYAVQYRVIKPRKKDIFLYKSIRLVFAHRTPDDSNLSIEYDHPKNPKYLPID